MHTGEAALHNGENAHCSGENAHWKKKSTLKKMNTGEQVH